MNSKLKLLILSIFTFSAIWAELYSQTPDHNEQKNMLDKFYKVYINEMVKVPMDFSKIDGIKVQYCSKNLISELEENQYDYDPFINDQDLESDLYEKMKIEKGIDEKEIFRISYLDEFTNSQVKIRLKVKKINGSYKIDEILE